MNKNRILVTLIFSAILSIEGVWLNAAELRLPVPDSTKITIDASNIIEPVNRRIFGVCLLYPPFDESFTTLFTGVFDGISAHAWGYDNSKDQSEVSEMHWQQFMPFIKSVGITDVSVMVPDSHMGKVASYLSEAENNLKPNNLPAARAKMVSFLNKTPHAGFPAGYGVSGWTTWDEPQFPQNGKWPEDDYAKYIVDCAKKIHEVDSSVGIGASMNEDNMQWNRQMLMKIAALNIKAVDFLEIHPFSFNWLKAQDRIGSYYARVAEAEVKRLHIRKQVALSRELGHGNWRLRANAWTIHPPGWTPPYECSIDMAVAIHAACMFGVFWDEGVDAACFFQLANRSAGKVRHFQMVERTNSGLKLLPPGEVFYLFGKYFRGNRISADSTSPIFSYNDEIKVPVVVALIAHEPASGQLTAILINRNREYAAPVELVFRNFRALSDTARKITISADSPESANAVVTNSEVKVPITPDFSLIDTLPPHSVSAIIINGKRTESAEVRYNSKMEYIRAFSLDNFSESLNNKQLQRNGVGDISLPINMVAGVSGFLDIASILDRSGLRQTLSSKSYESLSHTWVFSPLKQQVKLMVESIGDAELEINGKESGKFSSTGVVGKEQVVKLQTGWNKLIIKNRSCQSGMGFSMAIEKNGNLLIDAGVALPPWPSQWDVKAQQGSYTSSWKTESKADKSQENSIHLSRIESDQNKQGYLKWDLSKLPPNLDINQVDMEVVLTKRWNSGKGFVWLREVKSPWEEKSLCADQSPTIGKSLMPKVDVNTPLWVFGGKEIKDMIISWMNNPQQNYGICIQSNVTNHAGFISENSEVGAPIIRFTLRSNKQ